MKTTNSKTKEALMRDHKGSCPRRIQPLRKGQLWKLKRGYVYIEAPMGCSIHFKLLDSPDQTGGRILASGLETLLRYVQSRNGKLIPG